MALHLSVILVLNFYYCTCRRVDESAFFVDKTLRLYSSPNVEKLLINFKYNYFFNSQVDEWTYFAMRHKASLGLRRLIK